IDSPNFLFSFVRSDDLLCCNFSTAMDNTSPDRILGEGTIELLTPPLHLVAEMYKVSIVVRERGFDRILCAQMGSAFHMRHAILNAQAFGVFHERGQWSVATTSGRSDSLRNSG